MSYFYEATYEAEDHLETVIACLEVRVEFNFEPGKRAPICRIEGRQMEPDDGPEVEIIDLEVEDIRRDPKGEWETFYRRATPDEREALDTWLETTVLDDLVDGRGHDIYAAAQW